MSTRIRPSIASIAFVYMLLSSSVGASEPAVTANAVTCLPAPTSSAPLGSHWYYRTDRTTQRQCWYLAATHQVGPVQTAQLAAPSKPPQSVPAATPLAERGHGNLSDKEVAKLYIEFVEWSRGAGYASEAHE